MKKLDADQTKALLRAAKDANEYQKDVMTKSVSEIRKFLTTEGQGGMKTVEFDRTDFIAAGQRVQDRYAKEKGAEFTEFVQAIRAAGN
jgi:TRAP-type C4-dicarboxylate transport system substrate-binding protein